MRNKIMCRKKSGQAIVEYIIIVAIVAIASIAVIGFFGDRIKAMFSGATTELGSDEGQAEADKSSAEQMKEMESDGMTE